MGHEPLDNHSFANLEFQRRASRVASVELFAIAGKRPAVVDGNCITFLGSALAFTGVDDFDLNFLGRESGCGG